MNDPLKQASPFIGAKRYVADATSRFDNLKRAAEDYPDAIASDTGLEWMRRKPFDASDGHANYFACIYAASNIIQAMRLRPGALVVEVGAGPGWLTQILVGLGYRVVAVEPSPLMNALSQRRLEGFAAMTGASFDPTIFVEATLEQADLSPYLGQASAVLFHEALHHVIDEHASIRCAFELLETDGCLAVCGEGRWYPGDRQLEEGLDEEMKRYGTLESPFTQEYLRHVLAETGFSDITFYHSVNGLFPETQEKKTIRAIASPSVDASNTVLAWRRPAGYKKIPAAAEAQERTSAGLRVISRKWENDQISVEVELRNTGATYWPVHQPSSSVGITMALTQGRNGKIAREAPNRFSLERPVFPGESLVVAWRFNARGFDRTACQLRLIAEDAFWFGQSATLQP